jgi:hypothetical protein
MPRYAIAIAVAGFVGWWCLPGASLAQGTACVPNATLTEAQVARNRSAISLARQINTAEAKQSAATKRYVSLSELTGVTLPEGFEAQVSTDGQTYTFSVKDVADPCKSAVFSDQHGLIYRAMPLQ